MGTMAISLITVVVVGGVFLFFWPVLCDLLGSSRNSENSRSKPYGKSRTERHSRSENVRPHRNEPLHYEDENPQESALRSTDPFPATQLSPDSARHRKLEGAKDKPGEKKTIVPIVPPEPAPLPAAEAEVDSRARETKGPEVRSPENTEAARKILKSIHAYVEKINALLETTRTENRALLAEQRDSIIGTFRRVEADVRIVRIWGTGLVLGVAALCIVGAAAWTANHYRLFGVSAAPTRVQLPTSQNGDLHFEIGRDLLAPFLQFDGGCRAQIVCMRDGKQEVVQEVRDANRPVRVSAAKFPADMQFFLDVRTAPQDVRMHFVREDNGKFAVLGGGDWVLEKATLAFWKGPSGELLASSLQAGDSVSVTAANDPSLYFVEALGNSDDVFLPRSSSTPVAIVISRKTAIGQATLQAQFLPSLGKLIYGSATCVGEAANVAIVNELTGGTYSNLKDGELIEMNNPQTRETIGYQFMPTDVTVFPAYYPCVPSPDRPVDSLVFRPREIRLHPQLTDSATGQLISKASISCSKLTFLPNENRLFIPPPNEREQFDDIELLFAGKGYRSVQKSMKSMLREMDPSGTFSLSLDRTHTNIAIVWPLSQTMARELGPQPIQVGAALVSELKAALEGQLKNPGILGYHSVQVFVLKDRLFRSDKNLTQVAYQESDKPMAMVPWVANSSSYNVYPSEDDDGKGEFGAHTVVVPCFPAGANFPSSIEQYRRLRTVCHVHGVGVALSQDDVNVTYLSNFLSYTCDSYSILTGARGTEELRAQARRIAEELRQALAKKTQLPPSNN